MDQVEADLSAELAASAMSADDLLAQMAGDEIDRMLDEADNDGVPVMSEPALQENSAALDPAPAAQSDAMPDGEVAPEDISNAIPADAAPPAADVPPPPAAEITPPPAPAAIMPAAEVPVAKPAGEPLAKDHAKPPSAAAAKHRAPDPPLLRFLEWLNSPLDGFDQSMRNMVGHAAILTLFNAAALLTYVFFFRHK